ncbi:MAG: hypothetical protein AABW81_02890 [Nanoarchaeota archaeon]
MVNYNDLSSEDILRYITEKYPNKDKRLESISEKESKLYKILKERDMLKIAGFSDSSLVNAYDSSSESDRESMENYGIYDLVDFLKRKTTGASEEYIKSELEEANYSLNGILDGFSENENNNLTMRLRELVDKRINTYDERAIDYSLKLASEIIEITKGSKDDLSKEVKYILTDYALKLSKLKNKI